ncbi:MAG: septal ring lytic transglycosylase RlpA family protein [Verrucomicrobia subdivision 3 bacterium]|nr:septal ring lytic transglycosylase RlpA family protein [Limisphaerales bacterium]
MNAARLIVIIEMLPFLALAQEATGASGKPTFTIAAQTGTASWYGEEHRGKLMANGRPFDPDKLTAASWFYPLGTRVRVGLPTDPRVLNPQTPRSVVVTITDRGPAHRLVREGRIIDLSYAAFKRLGDPMLGLIDIVVEAEAPKVSRSERRQRTPTPSPAPGSPTG